MMIMNTILQMLLSKQTIIIKAHSNSVIGNYHVTLNSKVKD